jgi:hypothetical protein
LAIEILDLIFVWGRIITSIVLLGSVILGLRLIYIYKGGVLQKPWLLLIAAIVVFALAQLASAAANALESDLLRVVAAALSLVGSLSIFGGLLRIVNAWKNMDRIAVSQG